MFTEFQINEIIDKYKSGKSLRAISKEYGVSITPIRKIIADANLEIRSVAFYKQKYVIDEHYFDEINTSNKAYILGFLYADGGNTSNYENGHHCIALTLQQKDCEILEKIRNELKSNYPIKIRTYNNIKSCTFNICNKNVVLRLHELGIIPNKTLTLKFPEWLDKNLYSHFIRGYFDGDGCITVRRRAVASQLSCSITSTKNMCDSIKNIIFEKCNVNSNVYDVGHEKCNKNIKTLMFGGNLQCKRFLDYIYQNADLKLERKYKRYIEWYYNN